MKSAFISLTLALAAAAQTPPQSVTVPVTLDHNRIIIDVSLPLADGSQKRVRGWVDTGNADVWMSERVAKLMALQPMPGSKETESLGAKVRDFQAPKEIVVGGMKISFAGVKSAKMVAADSIGPGSSAEINLPSTVLRNYDLVMDYVDRELTLAAPGQVKFTGRSAKAFVNPPNGMIQVPAKIEGKAYQLTFDLGANFSMLAGDLFEKLANDNPKWPRNTGAVGTELFWGEPEEATQRALRVPAIEYGPVKLAEVGFDILPQSFMSFYNQRAGAEASGLLGANALLNYRVGIDYAHSTVYFDERGSFVAPGIDVVGLTLRPEIDGRYTVIGVPDYEGKPAVPEAKAGDLLVAIDKVPAKGSTMGQIWSLLGGDPGETRVLTLERDGKQFTVNATVRRFLPLTSK
jgi:Aspartyl protease